MGPVDLIVVIFDILEHIGRFHDTCRDDGDILVRPLIVTSTRAV